MALTSDDVFVVEEHSGSDRVTFGQIEPMTYIDDRASRHVQAWWVRLEFDDFQTIEAPHRAGPAFDTGFVFLHELLHAQRHRDGTEPGDPGECERILNYARVELGLPLRADYAATWWRASRGPPRRPACASAMCAAANPARWCSTCSSTRSRPPWSTSRRWRREWPEPSPRGAGASPPAFGRILR